MLQTVLDLIGFTIHGLIYDSHFLVPVMTMVWSDGGFELSRVLS